LGQTEDAAQPVVDRLLDVGLVDGLIDVRERVEVSPPDLDSLLVQAA
jgi:hypothetical protein